MNPNLGSLSGLLVAEAVFASGNPAGGPPTVGALTPGGGSLGMTAAIWSKFSWTAAQINALGAVATGGIPFFVLPKNTVVLRVIIVPTVVATGVTQLDVGIGLTAPYYSDYLLADGMTTTIVGLENSEFGTPLQNAFALPSTSANTTFYLGVGTTDVGKTMADVRASAGDVYVETVVLP
jgi:hypothetical protein